LQHLFDSGLVRLPFLAIAKVLVSQLPALARVAEPLLEAVKF
jgi:hypothetical protein